MKGIKLFTLEDKPLDEMEDHQIVLVDFDNKMVYLHPHPFKEWLESNDIKEKEDSIIMQLPNKSKWIGISIDLLIRTEKNPEVAQGLEMVKERYLNE